MRALLIVAVLILSSPVYAQGVCGNRADIIKRLALKYQERVVGQGIAANGSIVEVYAAKSGSWTITMRHPSGLTCLVATGQNWQQINDKGQGI